MVLEHDEQPIIAVTVGHNRDDDVVISVFEFSLDPAKENQPAAEAVIIPAEDLTQLIQKLTNLSLKRKLRG